MVQYIFTPWRDRAELLRVRAQFYPDKANDNVTTTIETPEPQLAGQKRKRGAQGLSDREKYAAVARVAMWMQRGGCPHVVESTALLTAAALSDIAASADGSGAAVMGVRAEYAMGFSRFVTGLLDMHQGKRHKQSMYSLARGLDLPPAFVELRHQISHEALPPLRALRVGAARALEWMWGYYWFHIDASDEPEEEKGERQCRRAVQAALLDDEEGEGVERLRQWDNRMVLRLLLEAGDKDGGLMLQALRIAREIVGDERGREKVGMAELPRIREEIEEQKARLRRKDEDEDDVHMDNALAPPDEDDGPAWREYQGVWVPKPIGVV